jgi:hypothetical protein
MHRKAYESLQKLTRGPGGVRRDFEAALAGTPAFTGMARLFRAFSSAGCR